MTTGELVFQILTFVLALWGAILSTRLFMIERQKNQRRMLVELSLVLVSNPLKTTYDDNDSKAPFGMHTEIKVYGGNIGHRPVPLAEIGILVDQGRLRRERLQLISSHSQGELTEGQSREIMVDTTDIMRHARHFAKRNGDIKLVGYFTDPVHGFYRSKPVRTNVNDWIPSRSLVD